MLGGAVAAQGTVTPLVPGIMALGSGYLIGSALDYIYERIRGQTLGEDIYLGVESLKRWLRKDGDPCK